MTEKSDSLSLEIWLSRLRKSTGEEAKKARGKETTKMKHRSEMIINSPGSKTDHPRNDRSKSIKIYLDKKHKYNYYLHGP
jgi:hypothetical protein